MDYKLIRSTILICSLSVLIILGLVFYANNKPGMKTQKTEASASGQVENDSDTSGQNGASGSQNTGSVGHNIAPNGDTRAFLHDETFWDPEPKSDVQVNEDDSIRLSLIATSVQRDLRLQVVDSEGKLVTGESFYVTVEDVGQFKDLDKDGVIYIAQMDAGDYRVSIDPLEGYHVAASTIQVHVNDKVEYRAINDIELFILSEEQIDLSKDAVTTHNLNGDIDDTEFTQNAENLDTAVMGIDVSSWNGDIDWELVRASGIEFAIIRCGYRGYTTGSLVEDKYFLKNIIGANEAGVKVGLYFFTQAVTEVEAVEEASMVITLCRDYQVDLPIFIDTESTGGNGRADGLDKATRTLVCKAFCETIESAGYRSGVYASKNWINQMLDYSQLTKYLTWLAEYKEAPTYTGDYQFWQYTSNGWVDGITGRVDLNIGNLSLANLQEELVKEEAVTPTPVPESEEDAEPTVTPEVESTEEVEPTVTPDAGEQ